MPNRFMQKPQKIRLNVMSLSNGQTAEKLKDSFNSSEFDSSIHRHSGIRGAANEAVFNNVNKKKNPNIPP
jgi:hypothetical protein